MTSSLSGRAKELIHDTASALKRQAARSPRLRKVVYAVRNRQLFADLAQHDRMLADRVRTEAYWAGLQKHVKPGDVVVDLGTGSGVLAFFAARAGAQRVHAIEHGPMADVAEAVARDNGLDNVEIHRMHSGSFRVGQPVDVIVHEQIGEALFDERVVDNVADLRDRVLKPGGLILPARLQLYIEPVQMTDQARTPFAWEQKLHGIDFRAIEPFGSRQDHGYRYPVLRPFPFERFLTEPEPVVAVDLHTCTAADLPRTITYTRTVTSDGILDGMAVYFRAGFDDEIWFTSSPDQEPTSWGSPLLRVASRPVRAGDTIELRLTAEDLAAPRTWDWEVKVVSPAT